MVCGSGFAAWRRLTVGRFGRRVSLLHRPAPAADGPRRPSGRGIIRDMVSISRRLAEVEDRTVPGRWEGNLVEAESLSGPARVQGAC
ncbi:hypothetical protein GCM10018779_51550 [Streptomyces griseocarneus]|nr:hypothetical protein GCM10018779_51550 [Streptomyces griseocarneus]